MGLQNDIIREPLRGAKDMEYSRWDQYPGTAILNLHGGEIIRVLSPQQRRYTSMGLGLSLCTRQIRICEALSDL